METINFRNKIFNILNKLENNKLHVSYKNKDFIIVPFDNANDFNVYVKHKKYLKQNRIEMSKIKKLDKKRLLILEEFIDGEILTKIIAENKFNEKLYEELFRVFRNNRFAKISLDYKPNNFILKGKYFYYINENVFVYNERNSFEKTDDILLWVNSKNQKDYVEKNGYKYEDRKILSGGELNKEITLICVKNW